MVRVVIDADNGEVGSEPRSSQDWAYELPDEDLIIPVAMLQGCSYIYELLDAMGFKAEHASTQND